MSSDRQRAAGSHRVLVTIHVDEPVLVDEVQIFRRLFELAEESRLDVQKESLEAQSAAAWEEDEDDNEV